jgi:hypothetical protein
MSKFSSSSVAKKTLLFAAVVGATGALAGSVALAQSGVGFGTQTDVNAYSKEQCKDGGWQTLGDFKNQGDCVSYFAKGGDTSATTEE